MAKNKFDKRDMVAKTQGVEDLKRSVESNQRKRFQSTASEKVLKYLKEKYGTVANGINTLALKDMGEL
jgi:hypothetical protein